MKILRINEASIIGSIIQTIEKAMDDAGIKITGNNMKLEINGVEYHIGQDSCEFPRLIDEPFWRDKE